MDKKNREAARLAALPHAAEAYRMGAEGLTARSLLPIDMDRPAVKAAPLTATIAQAIVPPRAAALAATAAAPMASALAPTPEPINKADSAPGSGWSPLTTITRAAELCIENRVAHNVWGDDSTTQVRTGVAIFVFANGNLPVREIAQRHFGAMSSLFSKMPTSWGRTKDELERGLAATMERALTLPPAKIGLHVKTQRKHFTWVHAVLDYAAAHGIRPAEQVTTKALTKGRDSTPEHEKRMAWDGEELFRLLRAAVWMGSRSLKKRFLAGWQIWHDGCYFVPLMLILLGPRSAEAAGLTLLEVHEDAPIPYIHFQETKFRGLKTGHSKRMVPIPPELIRLGFIDYVKALRADGEELVFPELYYPNNKSGFDSPFYKKIFRHWRAACFPDGTEWCRANGGTKDKDAHSLRGSFTTLVKCNERIRGMLTGHAGEGQSSITYDQRTDLAEMLTALDSLSYLTKHIEPRPLNLLPRHLRRNT